MVTDMRLFITLFIGLLIGGGMVFFLYAIFSPAKNANSSTTKSLDNNAQPSISSKQSNPPQNQLNQQQMDKLRQQFQQQGGLPLTASVEKVYPGIGFIMKDATGNRIFVHWTKAEPKNGEQVTVIGKPSPASNAVNALQNQSGDTQELKNFLQNQQFYVEATTVAPASTTSTTPSPTSF